MQFPPDVFELAMMQGRNTEAARAQARLINTYGLEHIQRDWVFDAWRTALIQSARAVELAIPEQAQGVLSHIPAYVSSEGAERIVIEPASVLAGSPLYWDEVTPTARWALRDLCASAERAYRQLMLQWRDGLIVFERASAVLEDRHPSL